MNQRSPVKDKAQSRKRFSVPPKEIWVNWYAGAKGTLYHAYENGDAFFYRTKAEAVRGSRTAEPKPRLYRFQLIRRYETEEKP